MNELFNTSKTNWLELEADPAKTTNAAIEEVQKKNAQVFAMAIAEARRAEEQKSKQYMQLAQIVGQGTKLVGDIQNWKDKKDLTNAYRNKAKPREEVDPPTDEAKPEPPKKDPKEEEEKKQEEVINTQSNIIAEAKNREVNASESGHPEALNNKELTTVLTDLPQERIKRNSGTAILFVDENLHTFMNSVENEPILLKGMRPNEAKGSGGRWTIRQAVAAGETEIARELKWHYRGVFLMHPQLKNLPNRIINNKIIPKMLDYDQKARAAKDAALRNVSVERHKENRREGLESCIIGGGGISCLVGTKENPNSGHVGMNEGRLDGTKDNAQGWKIALEDLEFLADNDRITAEQLRAIATGKVPLRQAGGTESYMNEVKNLGEYEEQILRLADKVGNKRFKEDTAKRKSLISSANTVSIAKLLEDKNDNVRIDNEYIDKALTLMQKDLEEDGIFVTKDELRAIDNSIDKFNTWEEVSDENITEAIDKLIDNKIAIPNADSMLVQIDDPELYKKYTKKVDEHRVRLSLVDADDAKKFNAFVLPTINSYLKLTQSTTLKTPEKRDLIDNALKIYKEKVAATHEDLGLDKAKMLARDEIEKEIAAAAKNVEDLPGKYTERSITEVDVPQIKRIQSTKNYIKNTPNAITDNKPWSIETPEVIQQRKDYLAGKAAPPLEYILMSNEFPNHTYHSLMETREAIDPEDAKEGFEGKEVVSKEEEAKINNADKLTKNNTPQRTFTALTSNDINQVLDIARKTDDVNSLLHANLDSTLESPLERLGFDRPLSELSVDEIRGLVNDDSFHGFSDSKFGLFSIPGNQLKTIFERESIDGDRLFDEDLQNELALLNIRYKANQANSLSTISTENTRLTNISRREQKEFLEIMGILSGDKDSKEIEKTAEWEFLNSPFNQLDVLIPAVQSEVIQKDPSKSTGIDWKGVGWPFVGAYQGMNERHKKTGEAIKQRGKEVRQQRAEQEQMFPTK
jgi:hypothetical protein